MRPLPTPLRRPARVVASAAAATLLTTTIAGAQTLVDTCGQQLDGDGILLADLDCSAAPLPSVTFTKSARLLMTGNSIIGEVASTARRLEIVGPGTITGPGNGIRSDGSLLHGSQVIVRGVTILGNDLHGIVAAPVAGTRSSVHAIGCTIGGNGGHGIEVLAVGACPGRGCAPVEKLRVEDSVVNGNGLSGVSASSIDIRGSSINFNTVHGIHVATQDLNRKLRLSDRTAVAGNGDSGIYLDSWSKVTVRLRDSDVGDNPIGINDRSGDRMRLKLKDTNLSQNEIGISTGGNDPEARKKVTVNGGVIVSSQRSGIVSTGTEVRVTVKNAMLKDGGTAAECGVTEACADLDTATPPRLRSATCETSHVNGSGIPGTSWGLCSLD